MTDAELSQMEYLWRKGVSVADIARLMHYSQTTVYQVASRHRDRFPPRNTWRARRSRDAELVEAALEMFADGKTGKQVADELGISRAMAYRIRRGFV